MLTCSLRRPGRSNRLALRALPPLLIALACALASGCGRPAKPTSGVPVPPARTARPGATTPQAETGSPTHGRPAAGYVIRRDSLDSVDGAVLRGRRIAIDPGHGGYFRGCMGVNGLSEAEVNLGVSLRLRALLVAQGANVLMTRERDRDFLTPADSSLKSDLAERARLANALEPELFVSVHHNADAGGLHDVNETQTYYKLGDDGPSYEAGTDVHRSLVRNVGIETSKLLPGNFSVVRNSEAPALLTESSYLTNPDVEARLRTSEAQQLEAEAIYLGVARWFARKRPVVESFLLAGTTSESPSVALTGRPEFEARIGGEFDAADVRVDGVPLEVTVAGDRVFARVREPLGNGVHEASLTARLSAEGAAAPRRLPFVVYKPVTQLDAAPVGEGAWNGAEPRAVRVLLRDADALPIADEQPVSLRLESGHGVAPTDTTVTAVNGEAWVFLRATRPLHRDALKLFARTMGGTRELHALATLAMDPAAAPRVRTGFVTRMPEGARLANPGLAPWLSRDGFATVRCDSAGLARAPRLRGYRAWGDALAWPPARTAIAGGALHGKRIALDPEGGGDDAAGMGRSGTRAATLNLEVARALAAMLEAAGADVALTRTSDAAVSELERVQVAESFRADRYLRIGHAAAPPVAGYYFSSGGGRRWALRVAQACAELGLADSLAVADVAKYALSQASAVALYASLARVDSAASEEALLAPGRLRAEAYALFVALAREFAPGGGESWRADSVTVRRADGTNATGAFVTLGDALVLQADAMGRVRFVRTEPGPLEIEESRLNARTVLLDSDRARILTGTR